MNFEARADAVRKRRAEGASPDAKEALKAFNEAQKDWTARCRVCGETLTGSLRELIEHRHVAEGS